MLTSFLILIFGEIVPKAFGFGNAESWSLTIASPVRLVERISKSRIWIDRPPGIITGHRLSIAQIEGA